MKDSTTGTVNSDPRKTGSFPGLIKKGKKRLGEIHSQPSSFDRGAFLSSPSWHSCRCRGVGVLSLPIFQFISNSLHRSKPIPYQPIPALLLRPQPELKKPLSATMEGFLTIAPMRIIALLCGIIEWMILCILIERT